MLYNSLESLSLLEDMNKDSECADCVDFFFFF